MDFHILPTNKCIGSLEFRVNDYLALLVLLSKIKRVRHLNQIAYCLYARVLLAFLVIRRHFSEKTFVLGLVTVFN